MAEGRVCISLCNNSRCESLGGRNESDGFIMGLIMGLIMGFIMGFSSIKPEFLVVARGVICVCLTSNIKLAILAGIVFYSS